jgi:hypothetical protein
MNVEVYTTEETTRNQDDIAEVKTLIESLGLDGQRQFVEVPAGSINPYRRMTADEQFIYETLMPNTCKPEKYTADLIPLRVLQVLAHARSLEYFDELTVRYPALGQDDPVLIGTKNNPGGTPNDLFILARWGEALKPVHELMRLALAEKKRRVLSKYEEIRRSCDVELANLRDAGDDIFRAKSAPTFYSW